MEFDVTDLLDFPPELVFKAFRDNMVEIAPHLTNIETIVVHERRAEGKDMHVISTWEAKVSFPGPMEKLIPLDKRKWRDVALWHEGDLSVEWRLEMPIFPDAVKVHGRNHFEKVGKQTKIVIHGDLTIDPSKIKGVPTFVAKTIVPTIEKFVVTTVKKNTSETNRAVERFLAARK